MQYMPGKSRGKLLEICRCTWTSDATPDSRDARQYAQSINQTGLTSVVRWEQVVGTTHTANYWCNNSTVISLLKEEHTVPVSFIKNYDLVSAWRQCHLLLSKHLDLIPHNIYASVRKFAFCKLPITLRQTLMQHRVYRES